MQESPLLEQIDWFFTSVAWTSQFPMTLVFPLAKSTSDHLPSRSRLALLSPRLISLGLKILFQSSQLYGADSSAWLSPVHVNNSAHMTSAKFKLLRRVPELRAKNHSDVNRFIANCNMTIAFLDNLEEIRGLF
jgi:hypothetical protein